jgi:tetratricopeptide (TPR) repeat protein
MTIRNLINYLAIGLMITTLSLLSLAARVQAQTKPAADVQETDDKVKVDMYTRFIETYKNNEPLAHHIALDYLKIYAKDKDRYSDYLQSWVAWYEQKERKKRLLDLSYADRNYVEAFAVGKQVLVEDPDHLDSLIALGNAGYLAAAARNTNFDKEAIGYAKRAIQLLEAGKVPDAWKPYKGKDEALAYLYSTIGVLQLKPSPNEAIEPLIKSAQFESPLKTLPSTFYYLAQAYQTGPYAKLSADFQTRFGGKPETPESKQALDKLNQVIDVMIDAYARAVALSGNDPQYAQNKGALVTSLTAFYKFRHQDSDAGLTEFVAGIMSKPLPAKP